MSVDVPEPRSQSGCATCRTARCCVVFDPEMTGADVHRLVRGLSLAPIDFAELRPVRLDQGGADAIILEHGCGWELRLRRTSLRQLPDGDRRCGFLAEVAPGVMRCGVYAQRPMVCRTFPTDLTPFGVMVANPEAICPPDAWSQARADLTGLHRLHMRAAIERRVHQAFVARWNESPPDVTFDALTGAMLSFWDVAAPLITAPDPLALDAVRTALEAALEHVRKNRAAADRASSSTTGPAARR